jgi:hypothetical protein
VTRVEERHGSPVSPRGIFLIARARANAFVRALDRAHRCTFCEPNRRLRLAQAPAGGDGFAATDWRAFLIPPSLMPPPVDRAPLTAVVDSAVDATHPELAGVRVIGNIDHDGAPERVRTPPCRMRLAQGLRSR